MDNTALSSLVSQMTLREKIGQLTQLPADCYSADAGRRTGPTQQLGVGEADLANGGSILGWPGSAAECVRIQKWVMAHNRLHIPTLFMADVIHGWKTIFPIPLGLASSWDPEMFRLLGRDSAQEASADGVSVTFSPMVDLVRDPRWGRVMESTGEDPTLNGVLAAALVDGYQNGRRGGQLAEEPRALATCVKHFAAYGAPEGGREYNTVQLGEQELRENYLPGYVAAMRAGAPLVMASFNTVDGIPATANTYLQRDILRGEFGFDGVLISDFDGVAELEHHGVAREDAQAAQKALQAGCDIEMASTTYLRTVEKLVREGDVDEKTVDEAVLRVLRLKRDLGLFDHPFRAVRSQSGQSAADPASSGHCAHSRHSAIDATLSSSLREDAYTAACRSIVLLKNAAGADGRKVLPLQGTSVALAGPFASSHDLLGGWSAEGRADQTSSIAEALATVTASVGMRLAVSTVSEDPLQVTDKTIADAVRLAAENKTIILALGLPSRMSGEASSLTDLRLPRGQRRLVRQVRRVNPNVVVVLVSGRPLVLKDVNKAPAVVQAWYPGTEGAKAIADILLGTVNPSGKLTMSFPASVGQIPVHYDILSTGRPETEGNQSERYVSHYLDAPNQPAYCFGHGLSYSTFMYSDLEVSADTFDACHPLHVRVTITNTSDRDGTEIAQFYIRDLVGEVARPIKKLVDFRRVSLKAGESAEIEFMLEEKQVRYPHPTGKAFPRYVSVSDPGDFLVTVGTSSQDVCPPLRVTLQGAGENGD